MKTTENISLAGYAFTVETDAYEELRVYLDEIRTCFRNDPSADEITTDIEARIAELLRERCINGMVVDNSMVQNIKKRIGNPKQLAQEDAELDFETQDETVKEPKPEKKSWKNRRLYRNIDERVLGGVCSGLGSYFGIDKVIFRLFFLLFSFLFINIHGHEVIFGFASILYICLWIAMPAAHTDEQKREMKGKPINLKNYKEKDFNFEKEAKEVAQSPVGQTARRAGSIFLGIILLLIGLGGMLTCVVIPSIPSIIAHDLTEEIMDFGMLEPAEQFIFNLVSNFNTTWILILVNIGIIAIGVLYGAIMLLFDLKAPAWRPGLVLFIAWIISIFVTIAYLIKMVAEAFPTLLV